MLRRMIRNPCATLGWLLFAVVVVYRVSEFGSTWTWGRYGMPRSLVAADGWHYANGGRIDPVTKALIDGHCEEKAYLVMAGVLATLLTGLAAVVWRDMRRRRKWHVPTANRLSR